MRGTVAKRIRRRVYGTDYAPRYRKYKFSKKGGMMRKIGRTVERVFGMIEADDRRQQYQHAKEEYYHGKR